MASILNYSEQNFKNKLDSLLKFNMQFDANIETRVAEIIDCVRKEGDAKLLHYTKLYDHVDYESNNIEVTKEEIDNAFAVVSANKIEALKFAAKRIQSYHEKQMPQSFDYVDESGVRLGNLWRSIENVGIYVPGGTANYPSSVLMNAVAARVAGVDNIIMVVPTPNGEINPLVLVAARIAGVDRIFKIGGAQAVAALAYGTETVPKVDKIVGPGNIYVAAAKKRVFGEVGIDMIAGPSEILVYADASIDPAWVAADLLSQAEHDISARPILVAKDRSYADAVIAAFNASLKDMSRAEIAKQSFENHAIIVIAQNDDEAIEVINEIAPEHLELCVPNAVDLVARIRNAGAIFVGKYTPEAIGDYTAGPSHVLPTASTAKFSSGLSVFDFLKRVSVIECTEASFAMLSEATEILANEEKLTGHAYSITIRKS